MNMSGLRRITYLSGTRADFGLMQSSLLRLRKGAHVDVLATGMHLDSKFGNSLSDIEISGIPISAKVPIDFGHRDRLDMGLALGQCLNGVLLALAQQKPDVLLLLGDRGEMLAGALAALHLGVVTAHIHGGERSGTIDESLRHAISKLCTYHFVATQASRERLIRMGEIPERVCVIGAPGLDSLTADAHLSREQCLQQAGLPLHAEFVLALFHPVVQQAETAYEQTMQLLKALKSIGLPVLWLEPNADAGSGDILRALDEVSLPKGSVRAKHLSRHLFCSAMRECSVMVGNSSAGIIEASSFGTPVVNVGDRQRLRERNRNVQDVPVVAPAIELAVNQALSDGRLPCENVYGDGQAGERLTQLLTTLPLSQRLLEKFNSY